MTITLNNYLLNDPANQVYLNDEIDGLSLPSIRTSSGNYAGRDGGYVGAQYYGARTITLTGTVFSSNSATLEQRRRDIQATLRAGSVTMRLVTNAGAAYVMYCNLLDFQMPIPAQVSQAQFKIELLAGDPTIYDDTAGGALSASVSRIIFGGYTYPVIYPVVYAPGTPPTAVSNSGTVSVYPTITLTGVMTNPTITNQTTGLFFSLPTLVTGPGDVVVIDMRARTVTLNGGNIFGLIGSSSSWWSLPAGSSTVALTTTGGSDTVSAVLTWRSGYMGI